MVSGGIKGAHPLLLGKQSEEPSLSGAQTAAGHAPAEVLAPPQNTCIPAGWPAQARPRCPALCSRLPGEARGDSAEVLGGLCRLQPVSAESGWGQGQRHLESRHLNRDESKCRNFTHVAPA